MDTLTAIVELVRALVWPAVTVSLVYMLRGTIAELIGSLTKATLKYKDLELALNRDLEAAKSSLKAAGVTERDGASDSSESSNDLIALSELSPRAAIIETWIRVESAVASLANRKGIDFRNFKHTGPSIFHKLIQEKAFMPKEVAQAIMKLRDIRNRTAHTIEFQPAVDDAQEYVLLALAAIADLNSIK